MVIAWPRDRPWCMILPNPEPRDSSVFQAPPQSTLTSPSPTPHCWHPIADAPLLTPHCWHPIADIHWWRSLLGRAGSCPPTFCSQWANRDVCRTTFCLTEIFTNVHFASFCTGALLRFCRCRCKNFHGPQFAIFRPHGWKSSVIIRYFPKQGPSLQGPAVHCTDCTGVKSAPAFMQG